MTTQQALSLAGFFTMLGLSAPAHAYIDPATGSIILQATIGAVAGATLFLRTSLFKLKALLLHRNRDGGE